MSDRQCRHLSNASFCSIRSGSTLFAQHCANIYANQNKTPTYMGLSVLLSQNSGSSCKTKFNLDHLSKFFNDCLTLYTLWTNSTGDNLLNCFIFPENRLCFISLYSRLSLSQIPRDSLKHLEISVPRHIRVEIVRKTIN